MVCVCAVKLVVERRVICLIRATSVCRSTVRGGLQSRRCQLGEISTQTNSSLQIHACQAGKRVLTAACILRGLKCDKQANEAGDNNDRIYGLKSLNIMTMPMGDFGLFDWLLTLVVSVHIYRATFELFQSAVCA
jgi:hypothetical protein